MDTVQLKTRWNPEDVPLAEYPRPGMTRKSYLNLNGIWKYAVSASPAEPTAYDGFILVPYSPESLLSGVNRTLLPQEYLHYRRTFHLPEGFQRGRVLLHFGAVDMDAVAYMNGVKIGVHAGGYNPFYFDVTEEISAGENTLSVVVRDDTDTTFRTRSKQAFKRGGIWYTPSSGIWQTVWLECVPEQFIERLKIVPDFDHSAVTVAAEGNLTEPLQVKVFFKGMMVCAAEGEAAGVYLKIPSKEVWSPEHPNLYNLEISCGQDSVGSYFGMRKFEIKKDRLGNKRFYLNGEAYFMHGLLDQGYFSDGMYTAASDEALKNDIGVAKRLGFNTLRKHIKVEPMRWYYHCDTIGMLVWQDMPSGGARYKNRVTLYYPFIGIHLKDCFYKLFGRAEDASKKEFYKEYKEMLTELQNVTSLAMWVPFNEGWGQFDALKVAETTKEFDPARLVDHASGWHDQGGADFTSLHIYFKKIPKVNAGARAVILSEFGGYSQKIEGHSFHLTKTFGYKIFKDSGSLNSAFLKLYKEQVIPRIEEGLCADIYTQLSDVEDEVNGVMTYDRAVVKITEETGVSVAESIQSELKRICGLEKKVRSAKKK